MKLVELLKKLVHHVDYMDTACNCRWPAWAVALLVTGIVLALIGVVAAVWFFKFKK